MAIVRGQWYQRKDYPDQFYKVAYITSAVNLSPFDSTRYPPLHIQSSYLLANFRLLAMPPYFFLLNGKAGGITSITRSYVVNGPVIWGSASGHGSVAQSHALLDTTLKGRGRGLFRVPKSRAYLSTMQTRGSIQSHSLVTGNCTLV